MLYNNLSYEIYAGTDASKNEYVFCPMCDLSHENNTHCQRND